MGEVYDFKTGTKRDPIKVDKELFPFDKADALCEHRGSFYAVMEQSFFRIDPTTCEWEVINGLDTHGDTEMISTECLLVVIVEEYVYLWDHETDEGLVRVYPL